MKKYASAKNSVKGSTSTTYSWSKAVIQSAKILYRFARSARLLYRRHNPLSKRLKAGIRSAWSYIETSSSIYHYYRTRPGRVRLQFDCDYLCSISPRVLKAFIPYLIEQSERPRSGFGRQIRLFTDSIWIQRRCEGGGFKWYELSTLTEEEVTHLESHRMSHVEVLAHGRFVRRRPPYEMAEALKNLLQPETDRAYRTPQEEYPADSLAIHEAADKSGVIKFETPETMYTKDPDQISLHGISEWRQQQLRNDARLTGLCAES